jgi:hydroxymethylbilane synthase
MRIGTRGSALALWQARWVAEQLHAAAPHLPAPELVIIRTEGDRTQKAETPLAAVAGQGIFVREIEQALQAGEIDAAVHSAKDLPSRETPGTTLAAFCERGDPRDALVSPRFGTLDNLPKGARLATSSPRRIAQLLAYRPDLTFVPLRGNVDTRLAKLERGDADGLVLAMAGLTRLGRADAITEELAPELCLPQVGQGCVAVQCRADDLETAGRVHEACDHFVTRREVVCERAFLAQLGGGCSAPVAAYAQSSDRFLYLFALVASPDGSTVLRTRSGAPAGQVQAVADGAFQDLLLRGARRLLDGGATSSELAAEGHATGGADDRTDSPG